MLMVSFTPGQMQILINEIDGERSQAAGTEQGLLESGREMDDQQQRTWGRSEVTITLRAHLQLPPWLPRLPRQLLFPPAQSITPARHNHPHRCSGVWPCLGCRWRALFASVTLTDERGCTEQRFPEEQGRAEMPLPGPGFAELTVRSHKKNMTPV